MRYVAKALLLSVASLALAGGADAATYTGATTYFYVTGDYTARFRIDTGSTIVDPDAFGFQITDVLGNFPGSSVGYAADVSFFTTLGGGGFEIDDNYGTDPIGPLLITDGVQLFSGTSASPTFTLGSYVLAAYEGSGTYQLRITNVADPVPEPSTWAMAVLGFGAVGFAMRRSNRSVSVRFA